MDSKEQFFKTIHDYYLNVVGNNIEPQLMNPMCLEITDYYYEQYTRFGKQYPKSIKRYSTFQIKDLDHPQTFEIIVNFFKKNIGSNYREYAIIVLQMTLSELQSFEKNREDYYNK